MNALCFGNFFPVRLFKGSFKRFIYVDVHSPNVMIEMKKNGFRKCDKESTEDLDVFVGVGGTEVYYFKNQYEVSKDCLYAVSTADAVICSGAPPMESLIMNCTTYITDINNYAVDKEFLVYYRFHSPKLADFSSGDVHPEFVVTRHSSFRDLIETTRPKLSL